MTQQGEKTHLSSLELVLNPKLLTTISGVLIFGARGNARLSNLVGMFLSALVTQPTTVGHLDARPRDKAKGWFGG